MKQKDVFLNVEGDAWFARNQEKIAARKLPEEDPLLLEIINLLGTQKAKVKILEIGCGNATRLKWLRDNFNVDCCGIEPSADAVAAANAEGIDVRHGTADLLPYENLSFDVVILGFCLYLCDREDLFRIASEVDRVLRTPGWLVIMDFFNSTPISKTYHHYPGILSFKMDYRTLFSWHPDYECMNHRIRHHVGSDYTDDRDDWVAISSLRKLRSVAEA